MTTQFYLFLIGLLGLFFIFNLFLLELGRKIGKKHLKHDPNGTKVGASQIEAALFTLLGLLIAFTFFGASERFESRRHLIVEEASAISTSWYEIDLLPTEAQPKMRDLFKKYAKARLYAANKLPDVEASKQESLLAKKLEREIWDLTVSLSKESSSLTIPLVYIPSLNTMFDLRETHDVALFTHPPFLVYLTLIILICVSSFFVGYSFVDSKIRKWSHGLGYTLILTGILFVILNFEYPRTGIINVKKFDAPMFELLEEMKLKT